MKQTVCSVGDAILLERFPESYDITAIKKILESADARLFNLENVLSDRPIYASSYCGGTWLLAKEDTLDDTLSFGFNGCSFANNHTMDFSYDGLFVLHCLKTLVENGKLLLPKENQRKSLTTIVIEE